MLLSTTPVTLSQYMELTENPLEAGVVFALINNGAVFDNIPMVTKEQLGVTGVRFEGNLPAVNWAPLNADPAQVSGTPKQFQEQVYIISETIDIAKWMVMDKTAITDPRGLQVSAALKAIAYDLNDKFINNDHASGNINSFVGIRYRVNNGTLFGVRPENLIDAGGVDLSTAGMTATTANNFMVFLDQLLWSVDAPNGDQNVTIYMNDVTLRYFRKALRIMGTQGGLDQTQDQFQRVIETYKGCKVQDIGYKADQATRIITTTETNTGLNGASTFTSIYAVNASADHFGAFQMAPLNVQDLGLLNTGNLYRTLIDWAVGFYQPSIRSLARLYDIKLA